MRQSIKTDTKMGKCGVCGNEAKPALKLEFEGKTYYFATLPCLIAFYIQADKVLTEKKMALARYDEWLSFGDLPWECF